MRSSGHAPDCGRSASMSTRQSGSLPARCNCSPAAEVMVCSAELASMATDVLDSILMCSCTKSPWQGKSTRRFGECVRPGRPAAPHRMQSA